MKNQPGAKKILIHTPGEDRVENQAFDLVNLNRIANGLHPLKRKYFIVEQAREHSRDIAYGRVEFGHSGSSERIKIISGYLKETTAGGENVLYCTKGYTNPAQSAVLNWLKSPGHRANIYGDYNMSGMGVVRSSNGSYYFTQIFVRGVE